MKFRPQIETLELRDTPSSLNGPGAVVMPPVVAGHGPPPGGNNAAQFIILPPSGAEHNPHGPIIFVGHGA